jgi:hypothetical protein
MWYEVFIRSSAQQEQLNRHPLTGYGKDGRQRDGIF